MQTQNMDYLYDMVSMWCENSNSKLIYLALASFHIDFALVVLGYEDKGLGVGKEKPARCV